MRGLKSGPRSGVRRAARELGVIRAVAGKFLSVEELVAEIASIIDEAVAALVAAREPTATETASGVTTDALGASGAGGFDMGA